MQNDRNHVNIARTQFHEVKLNMIYSRTTSKALAQRLLLKYTK